MNIYDYIQLAAGGLMAVSYIPQIIRLLRVRSSREISLAWLWMLFIAMAMVDIYALSNLEARLALFIANTMVMVLCGVTIALVIYYRKERE